LPLAHLADRFAILWLNTKSLGCPVTELGMM
jgi:hypothetical protein